MTQPKEDIIIGVAMLLGPKMEMNFSDPRACKWLLDAIEKYGEEGWRYHDSKSGSNYYRFKVWLLHIEGEVRIKYLEAIPFVTGREIEDEKAWYWKKVKEFMGRMKEYDKMN